MVNVSYDPSFKKRFKKIKDSSIKEKIRKQIEKIIINPKIGKPMRYERKGTREVYISPFRLIYAFNEDKLTILLLDLYHKDEQ